MENLTEEIRSRVERSISAGLSDDVIVKLKKSVSDILYEVETDIDFRLKEDLAPNLASYVVEMAEKTVLAILAGNEEEMRRHLSCRSGGYSWNGRSDGYVGNTDIAQQHPVIHGNLFEQGCIALRKSIVDAHRDLLVTERILDLEDQVRSLVEQVNRTEASLRRAQEDRYAC